jgi:hypothetical protein
MQHLLIVSMQHSVSIYLLLKKKKKKKFQCSKQTKWQDGKVDISTCFGFITFKPVGK